MSMVDLLFISFVGNDCLEAILLSEGLIQKEY